MKKTIVFLVAVTAFIMSAPTAKAQIKSVGVDIGYQRDLKFYMDLDPREVRQKDVYVPESFPQRIKEIKEIIAFRINFNIPLERMLVTKVLADNDDYIEAYITCYYLWDDGSIKSFWSGWSKQYYEYPDKSFTKWNKISRFSHTSIRVLKNGVLQ